MDDLSECGRVFNAELAVPPYLTSNDIKKTFLTSILHQEATANIFICNNCSAHVNKKKGNRENILDMAFYIWQRKIYFMRLFVWMQIQSLKTTKTHTR